MASVRLFGSGARPRLPRPQAGEPRTHDFSRTTIPTDGGHADWLTKPRKSTIGEIQRFLLFIGPISSIFDYATYQHSRQKQPAEGRQEHKSECFCQG